MFLVSLGCSWTKGVGVSYYDGITQEEYKSNLKKDCDEYSFRALLSKRLGYTNVDLSGSGSSNQRQERKAIEYFTSDIKNTLVIWGITSTARTELWYNPSGRLENFMFNSKNQPLNRRLKEMGKQQFDPKEYVSKFYNKEYEVERLTNMMLHWNVFFENCGIMNYWFDTFNTLDYKKNIPRMLKGDLLTRLTKTGKDHHSIWKVDCDRIRIAKEKGIVNPISLHPTKKGHVMIADILEKHIDNT